MTRDRQRTAMNRGRDVARRHLIPGRRSGDGARPEQSSPVIDRNVTLARFRRVPARAPTKRFPTESDTGPMVPQELWPPAPAVLRPRKYHAPHHSRHAERTTAQQRCAASHHVTQPIHPGGRVPGQPRDRDWRIMVKHDHIAAFRGRKAGWRRTLRPVLNRGCIARGRRIVPGVPLHTE